MARITCAISGIRFQCSFLESVNIQHTEGYFHPVFALPQKKLFQLYSAHTKGELTSTDSYLLFLAFLHSTGKVKWEHPAICNPTEQRTKQLVQNNLAQLIRVIEKTAVIKHPSFIQPSFKLTLDTAHLDQIPNWIKAWNANIESFNSSRADAKARASLVEVENKLSYLILSGEKPSNFTHVIANWASEAAGFPPHKEELWKQTIRSCFNMTKMFNTDLSLLKEIKEYCECNIEAGSIHFHTLYTVLREGISRHHDYLGGSFLARGYELLPSLTDRKKDDEAQAELLVIASNAPTTQPVESDYPTTLDFIKAKVAFRIAQNIAKKEAIEARAKANREILMKVTTVNEPEGTETELTLTKLAMKDFDENDEGDYL